MPEEQTYNYKVVRQFSIMTIIWGIVGMLVGVIIAAQLAWPALNFDIPWLTFGRLRPLHTNAVIFAFGGSALFATSYYVVQRTSHARLYCDKLAAFTFWGWQAVIISAVITLPLGITTSKEYAELEWPIDILITFVWVAYAVVFFGTIAKRKIKHIYVANWFYGSFIITIAVLHIVNSAAIPVSFLKSYSAYAGVQDAMIQWWYGHNAVGFFLTTGFLGMMYYFVPKQANRPVYSYRLSVVHFWAIIFTYIWAGPHHLHYTALPDWVQSLGMVMSLILLAPSWGGMINGIMTLSGAWDKLRTDPILRFLIVAISFYGMSTFEGPMMAIKTVNALDNVDLQQSGDGFIDVFITGAKRFEKLGIQGSMGGTFAIDNDHDSSMLHYSLHADYEVVKNVFPMIELNGFTVIDHGSRTPLGFEGVDLVNLGCSADCGTVLTAAGGMRFRVTDNLLLGLGVEKSIAREDLLDWRSYFDLVIHF